MNNIISSPEWLKLFESKKELLVSPVDLNRYFTEKEIAGFKLGLLPLGNISVPTGKLLVRDPLVYLNKEDMPYLKTVKPGTYPLTASVLLHEEDCERYAAVKVEFTNKKAVKYEEALIGIEDLEDVTEGGDYFGFGVDSGLATVVDQEAAVAYCDFCEKWEAEHPNKNMYDHYFADFFAKSYQKNPKYQREEGDWINWTIPGTSFSIPMFQSGYGDGAYPVYFGLDADGEVCQLVIHFIDVELENEEK